MKRIAIHGVPRSGTSWLGAIFDSHPDVIYRHQPLFSYSHKGFLTPQSSRDEILDFFEVIKNTDDPFVLQEKPKERGIIPSFKKNEVPAYVIYKEARYHNIVENLLKKDKEIKVIGIVRNPLSVTYSWLNAPKEFRRDLGWNIEEEWRFAPQKNKQRPEEFYGYEKWKEVAYLFKKLEKRYPKRFYLVQYKSLLLRMEEEVNNLFSFTGLSVTVQTKEFIKTSRAKHVGDAYSVYRKKEYDDEWKGNLQEDIVASIVHDLKGTQLEEYLD